jgi:5'-methylthioadenosine phosphorylase
VFLPRHDKGHRLSPSDINYRANIDALKRVGVTDLISLSACGSFKEELPPGTFVLVDQFVDRTHKRESSFFGKGCVAHVSMAHPVSPRLRIHLAAAAEAEGIRVVRDGTYVCMEGPQFSTKAESHMYRSWGGAIIGMTNLQEAKLAREAEMCFATIALATDYDCWHESEAEVSVEAVLAVMRQNIAASKKLLAATIAAMKPDVPCAAQDALKFAIMTPFDLVPAQVKKDLDPIIGRYLNAKR